MGRRGGHSGNFGEGASSSGKEESGWVVESLGIPVSHVGKQRSTRTEREKTRYIDALAGPFRASHTAESELSVFNYADFVFEVVFFFFSSLFRYFCSGYLIVTEEEVLGKKRRRKIGN